MQTEVLTDTPRTDAFVDKVPSFRIPSDLDMRTKLALALEVRNLMSAWAEYARGLERELVTEKPRRRRPRAGSNRRMWEKYERGDCVDLSQCARDPDGYYILERFEVGKDYCDLHAEAWIWSIGRRRSDGQILASTGSRLYQNPDFECLFLR